jgi:hypothetical protein
VYLFNNTVSGFELYIHILFVEWGDEIHDVEGSLRTQRVISAAFCPLQDPRLEDSFRTLVQISRFLE